MRDNTKLAGAWISKNRSSKIKIDRAAMRAQESILALAPPLSRLLRFEMEVAAPPDAATRGLMLRHKPSYLALLNFAASSEPLVAFPAL